MTPQERQRLVTDWQTHLDSRWSKQADQSIKIQNQHASLVERNFNLRKQSIQLQIEVARAQHDLLAKRIQMAKSSLEVRKLKESLNAWDRAYWRAIRRERSEGKRVSRLLGHARNSQQLLWGEAIGPEQLKRGWQGFFVCAQNLPFSSQAKIGGMRMPKSAMVEELCVFKKKYGKWSKSFRPFKESTTKTVRGPLEFFKLCRKYKAVPVAGTECHQTLVQCLAAIDGAAIKTGVKFEAETLRLRQRLDSLRSEISK